MSGKVSEACPWVKESEASERECLFPCMTALVYMYTRAKGTFIPLLNVSGSVPVSVSDMNGGNTEVGVGMAS